MQDSCLWPALGLSLVLALSGCASGANSADPASAASMSSSDAQAFVAEVQQKRGLPAPAPVNTIDELLEVLAGDQVQRFRNAEGLVAGKPGIDAMSLHASLELAWSDDFSTLGLILGELGKRADVEVKRLQTKRDTGTPLTDSEAKDLEQNQKNLEFDVKARGAVDTLAQDHLRAGEQVVLEARRQFPKDPGTYRVAAYHALLSGNWLEFDAAIGKLKDEEAKDAGLTYLRGLEALSRFAVRKDAAARFRAALQLNPKMARAQAKLMLIESEIDAKYAEFEKLKELAPQHPIVWLAGPSITSDYELSESFRKARAARQAEQPAAPPASPAPAGPAPVAAPPAVAPAPAPH
ncbi:MAG TPA: hypothetical protein VER96_07495 [Polyangiaceae bacterium]|nr:hypothetical protein [Polyangiaceae bacterium]